MATLEDKTRTRTERQALQAVLDDRKASDAVLALFRSRAFEPARDSVTDPRARAVITWLEDTVKTPRPVREETRVEAHFDPGSDVQRLREAGVPVRVDRSEAHMHHKFALFDRRRLLTGSYNWTRAAADANNENNENNENIVVSDDPRLVRPFCRAFDELWEALK